jgi:uncharacterized membrane protein required for colicin V production
MNWVDLALLLVVLLAVWGGWRSGFILGTLDLANWIGVCCSVFFFILTSQVPTDDLSCIGSRGCCHWH